MYNIKSNYGISELILSSVIEIAELVGRLSCSSDHEVSQTNSYNPYSMDDFLTAHRIIDENSSDIFRSKPVGVVDNMGNIIHFDIPVQEVPDRLFKLLKWLKESDIHILIKSCIFRYEFELIHPFMRRNDSMAELWQRLLLLQWSDVFSSVQFEALIQKNSDKYYSAIIDANKSNNPFIFVEYMLSVIKEALLKVFYNYSQKTKQKYKIKSDRYDKIISYFDNHEYIQNTDVQSLLDVSSATATRILRELTKSELLIKIRIGSHWGYKKNI